MGPGHEEFQRTPQFTAALGCPGDGVAPLNDQPALSTRQPDALSGPFSQCWDEPAQGGEQVAWLHEFEQALHIWNETFHPARG